MSPLPAGFKLNGVALETTIPPKIVKISSHLDKLPFGELLSSAELAERTQISRNGEDFNHKALSGYREKVGTKLFWGSPKTITDLRQKLNEDNSDENQ